MQLLLNLLGIAGSLLLSFISSGMETALYRVSRVRMHIRLEQGEDRRAQAVLNVMERLDAMVTTILIDNNIAAYAGTFFLANQLAAWKVPQAELLTTAILTPLFFILTESLPKQIAYNHADYFSLSLIRVFSAFQWVLTPAVWFLNQASALLRRILGARGEIPLAQSQRVLLLEHFNAGVAERVLTEEQNRMAVRIMELEGICAGDSMVPLRKLLLLPLGVERSRAIEEMSRQKKRLALLIDAAGRPSSKIVTLTALLMHPGDDRDGVEAAALDLERVRFGVAIPEVLNLFRRTHLRHALVVQGSRVVGLITTESVLARIAGAH